MATKYEGIRDNLLSWVNRDRDILGATTTAQNALLDTFLSYSADECYRKLRIPPFEQDVIFSVTDTDNITETNGDSYTIIPLPVDFTELIYMRPSGGVSNTYMKIQDRSDERTFWATRVSPGSTDAIWIRSGNNLYIKPQLSTGAQITIHYYRTLPALTAAYSVIPANIVWTKDTDGNATPSATQTYLTETTDGTGTTMYSIEIALTGTTNYSPVAFYSTAALRDAATYTTPTGYIRRNHSRTFTGNEVSNWLRDQNERLLVWGALMFFGSFLDDQAMEARYQKLFLEGINELNSEEKYRKARGGAISTSFSTSVSI